MSSFSHLLIWNVALATGLAIVIALAGCLPALQRRPALRHWLWLLVLVKLVTPPLIPLPILSSTNEASEATPVDAAEVGAIAEVMPLPTPIDAVLPVPAPVDFMPTQNAVDPPVATAAQAPAAAAGSSGVDWLLALLTVSLLITGLLLTRSIGRMIRLFRLFVRCNQQDRRASDIAAREAAKMQVRREPTVALVSARMTPLLWVSRRGPTIVLPAPLAEQLDDDQLACIIRHELAHFVRRDHYANAIAFIVASFFWWNPIAWWARREMQRAQEACCDSLVVASVPQSRRCYAETLLHVIDFLGEQNAPLPHLVAGFGEARSLKRRFEIVANEKVMHRLSWLAKALVACGAIAVSCYPVLAQSGAETQQSEDAESRIRDEWKVDSGSADSGLRPFRISARDPATVVKIAAALELLGANCDVSIKPGYDPEVIVLPHKKTRRKIAGLMSELGLAMPKDDRTVVHAAPKPDASEDDVSDDAISPTYKAVLDLPNASAAGRPVSSEDHLSDEVFWATFEAIEVRAALGTWADHIPTQKKLVHAIELLGGVCEITHDSDATLTEVKVVARQAAASKVRDYLRAVGFQVDKKKSDQAAGTVDAAEQPDAAKIQRVYSLQFADAGQVQEILSVIKPPDAVVGVQARTNQIMVQATEPQHRELAEVIAQLDSQEPPKSLAVIELTKSDPKAVLVLLRNMFEGTTEHAPKINVDLDHRRLIIRGTPAQVRQVRNLVVGLERLIASPGDQDDAATGVAASTNPRPAAPVEDDPFALPAAAPPTTGLPESAKVTTDGEGNVVGVKLTGESNLNRFAMTPEIIEALTKLKSLRTLSLWGTTVGDREIERFAALKHLQLIDLSFTDVTGDSLRALSSLKELVSLRLEGCEVEDEHLIALGDMPQLAVLYLGRTKITDAGLKHIRRLEKLNLLQLSDCQITDQGLASLGRIPRIQHLWLSKTIRNGEDDRSDLTDGCVDYLISLDTLVDLQIADSQLTESGLQRLREGLPKAKVSTQRTGITYGRRAADQRNRSVQDR